MSDLRSTFLVISILAMTVVYTTAADILKLKPTFGSNRISELESKNTPRATPISTTTEAPVTVLDRFYRVYEDGTTEWKIVFSNDVAQYQKITNKLYQGRTIQVYEGYSYTKLPDNTYRLYHYIADENGIRRLSQVFDNKPIPLPPYVPYVPKV